MVFLPFGGIIESSPLAQPGLYALLQFYPDVESRHKEFSKFIYLLVFSGSGNAVCTFLSNLLCVYDPGNAACRLSPFTQTLLSSSDSPTCTYYFFIGIPKRNVVSLNDACLIPKCPCNAECISDTSHYESPRILLELFGHPIFTSLHFVLVLVCNKAKDPYFFVVWGIPPQHFLRIFHIKDGSDSPVVQVSFM